MIKTIITTGLFDTLFAWPSFLGPLESSLATKIKVHTIKEEKTKFLVQFEVSFSLLVSSSLNFENMTKKDGKAILKNSHITLKVFSGMKQEYLGQKKAVDIQTLKCQEIIIS